MELEIRRAVAKALIISVEDVGVMRGSNMTIITTNRALGNPNEELVLQALGKEFGAIYVHLGLIRFL